MLSQHNHLSIWYATLFQYCYINETTWVKTESVLTSIMVSDVFIKNITLLKMYVSIIYAFLKLWKRKISGEFELLNNACWEGLLICKKIKNKKIAEYYLSLNLVWGHYCGHLRVVLKTFQIRCLLIITYLPIISYLLTQ